MYEFSTREVAELIDTTMEKIRRKIHKGEINAEKRKGYRGTKQYFIPSEEVDRLFMEHEEKVARQNNKLTMAEMMEVNKKTRTDLGFKMISKRDFLLYYGV